jgi:hypothetical protein
MKKLYLASLLSLALLALASSQSFAWFGRCSQCCTCLCIRPYNAFSPCCSGSLCCDGCMPLSRPECPPPAFPPVSFNPYGFGCCAPTAPLCDPTFSTYGSHGFPAAPVGTMAPPLLPTSGVYSPAYYNPIQPTSYYQLSPAYYGYGR